MLSVETAKAVVEVPSPYKGKIIEAARESRRHRADRQAAGRLRCAGAASSPRQPRRRRTESTTRAAPPRGQGMVVGHMASSDEEFVDRAIAGGVTRASARGPRARRARSSHAREAPECRSSPPAARPAVMASSASTMCLHAANVGPARARAPSPAVAGLTDADRLRGTRKAMAHSMSLSRDEIAMCTIFDDADIEAWTKGAGHHRRLIRAIAAGAKAEPGLNALFDPGGPGTQVHGASASRDRRRYGRRPDRARAARCRLASRRRSCAKRSNDLKERTRNRTVTPEEMRDYTFTLVELRHDGRPLCDPARRAADRGDPRLRQVAARRRRRRNRRPRFIRACRCR